MGDTPPKNALNLSWKAFGQRRSTPSRQKRGINGRGPPTKEAGRRSFMPQALTATASAASLGFWKLRNTPKVPRDFACFRYVDYIT